MTVPVQTPYVQYVADGNTNSFAYSSRIFAEDNLVVTLDSVVKTLTTDYTVSGVNQQTGGAVTFIVKPAAGVKVGIERRLTIKRLIDYSTTGDFRGDVVDKDFDYIVMVLQQLSARLDGTITSTFGSNILNAANNRLINLLDPVDLQDAVTKKFMLDIAADFVLGVVADQSITSAKLAASLLTDLVPAGACVVFPATIAPAGWLKSNGTVLNRIAYPRLWAYAQVSGNMAISDAVWQKPQFSPGDGINTFRIPDDRGYTYRNWDDGAGVDAGRAIGEVQLSQNLSHNHTATDSGHTHPIVLYQNTGGGSPAANSIASNSYVPDSGSGYANITVAASGGIEARVPNIPKLACIKY